MKFALLAARALAASPAASARAKRHCVGADGSEISDAGTKKQCKKAGGKWMKMKASNMAKSPGSRAKPPGKGSGFARRRLGGAACARERETREQRGACFWAAEGSSRGVSGCPREHPR